MPLNLLQSRHTDAEGVTKLVAQMETGHLLNTIRLHLRQVNKLFVTTQNKRDIYKSRLYGIHILDPEEAAEAINEIITRMAPYFFEAFFRAEEVTKYEQWPEIKGLMESFLQRSGRLDIELPAGLLPEPEEDDMEDDYYADWARDPDEGDR